MPIHFPAEIYSSIFTHLSKPDLHTLLTTAHSPSHEAERILYTCVQLTSERQLLHFIAPEVLTARRALLVRRLELGTSYYRTQQHIKEIHKMLKRMSRLKALRLNDSDGLLPVLRCQSLRLERLECSRVLMRRFDGKPVLHAVNTLTMLDAPLSVARSLLPGPLPNLARLRIVMEHHGEPFIDVDLRPAVASATSTATVASTGPDTTTAATNNVDAGPVKSVRALHLSMVMKWNGGTIAAVPLVFPNVQYLKIQVLDEPVFIDELYRSLESMLESLPHVHTFDISGKISPPYLYKAFKVIGMRLFEAAESLQEVRVDHWMWERGSGKEGKCAEERDPRAWMTVELKDIEEVKIENAESGIAATRSE